jgi:hypothetical protein
MVVRHHGTVSKGVAFGSNPGAPPHRITFPSVRSLRFGAVVSWLSVWSDLSILRALLVRTPNTDSRELRHAELTFGMNLSLDDYIAAPAPGGSPSGGTCGCSPFPPSTPAPAAAACCTWPPPRRRCKLSPR